MTDSIIKTLLVNTAVFSVLFGAMLLVRKPLKKRMSPAMLLALWAVVVIKLATPFGFEADISLFPSLPEKTYTAAAGENYEPAVLSSGYDAYAQYKNAGQAPAQTAPAKTAGASEGKAVAAPAGEKASSIALSWTEAAVCVWAAGALASGLLLFLSAAHLKRRMLHARLHTPLRVRRVFGDCRKALGITRSVGIVLQSSLLSPVIMGAVKPVLVLPENAAHISEQSLRHVMMHELVHLKRGDLWAIRFMNALSAVYWFNPLARLCFKYIREDMETACDHRVIKTLGQNGRLAYIGTVLQYAGSAKPERLAAAMGLADGRPAMEKRIKGMFGTARTGVKGRITAALLACLMLAVCALTACQPTPEKPFVQPKNNDSVQQAINSSAPEKSAEIHKFSAPATWQSSVRDEAKKIDINVNAQVSVPADTWGLYELVPQVADKAYLDNVLKAVIGTAEIYGEDTYLSRDDLEANLVQVKRQLERMKDTKPDPRKEGENVNPPKNTPAAAEGENVNSPKSTPAPAEAGDVQTNIDMVAELEKRVSDIENALAGAPDKSTTQRAPIDLNILLQENPVIPDANTDLIESGMPSVSFYEPTGEIYIHGFADTGKEEPAYVDFYKRPGGGISIKFQNAGAGNVGGFSGREPLTGEPLYKVSMTEEQAAGIARQAVSDMGLGYLDIAAVHKMSIYDRSRMDGDRMPECYAFTFNRNLDGVTAAYSYRGGGFTDEQKDEYEQQYAKSWPISEALIGVDDSGVVFAQINAAVSDVNKLAAGVELKSFDEIMDIFNQQAAIEGCFADAGLEELVVGRSVEVDEIKLDYMPTIWKDHPDQLIFVPVWDFFGSETTTYDENFPDKEHSDLYASLDENYQRRNDMGDQAILTINALDGTIMQRLPGPDW